MTEANCKAISDGQTNMPLTDVGRRQADAAEDELKDVHFDTVYTSDLARTMDTARRIIKV